MRKALLVLVVALAFVALTTTAVFATSGDSGYRTPSASPHDAFTTSSQNCAVCHAVHHANSNGEALMRGTIAGACTYCHITPGVAGYIDVYNGVENNYLLATQNGHNANDGAMCTGCHQVHAATIVTVSDATNAYLNQKILKTGTYSTAPQAADPGPVAVSKWCTSCHPNYYNEHYDGTSHVMTGTVDASGVWAAGAWANADYSTHRVEDGKSPAGFNGQVAWYKTRVCNTCHYGDTNQRPDPPAGQVVVQNSFPHWTEGVRFLLTATADNGAGAASATVSSADGVCIRCHRSGSGTASGVGYDF